MGGVSLLFIEIFDDSTSLKSMCESDVFLLLSKK